MLLYAQLCLQPQDCSPSGSSVHGIFQARILEWVFFHKIRIVFVLNLNCVCPHKTQALKHG